MSTASPRRVIVAGFGPVGRCVADQLRGEGVEVTIIELNAETVQTQNALGLRAVHGDAASPAVLKAAGIERADALIVTVPNEDAAVRACVAARELSPKIFIAARTNFVSRGLMAAKAGADEVIIEELVTAQAMRDAVGRHFGKSVS